MDWMFIRNYSDFNVSAGFDLTVLYDWANTVNKAAVRTITAGIANNHMELSILIANELSHLSRK